MSSLATLQTRSPQKNQHLQDLSAYQTFLDSDLDTVRENLDGGRRQPFGLLFEIEPISPSENSPSIDHLMSLPQPLSTISLRSRQTRKSDERGPPRITPSWILNKSRVGNGHEPQWEIYEDDPEENVSGCDIQDMSVSWEEEEEEEEEGTPDENKDIHQKARALAYLIDHVNPNLVNEQRFKCSQTTMETVDDFKETTSETSTLTASD